MTYTKLDQTDVVFIKDIIIKAAATWEMQMTDPTKCEANRDLARENAKIAWKAIDIIRDGEEEVGDKNKLRDALERIAHYDENREGMDDPCCADGHICADIARKALAHATEEERDNSATLRKAIDYLCGKMAELDATFDPNEVPCLRAALAHAKELKGESDGNE